MTPEQAASEIFIKATWPHTHDVLQRFRAADRAALADRLDALADEMTPDKAREIAAKLRGQPKQSNDPEPVMEYQI